MPSVNIPALPSTKRFRPGIGKPNFYPKTRYFPENLSLTRAAVSRGSTELPAPPTSSIGQQGDALRRRAATLPSSSGYDDSGDKHRQGNANSHHELNLCSSSIQS
jgi:hypothetical protein